MMSSTLILAALALMLSGVGRARAEFIITFSQQGLAVLAVGTGSLNLTDLSVVSSGPPVSTSIVPDGCICVLASAVDSPVSVVNLVPPTGPTSFGPGLGTAVSSGSGHTVGLLGRGELLVPAGYESGSPLLGSMTFDNTTISGLGLTPGTYTWTWGTGANADSFEIMIPGASSAPEPSTLTLLGLGLAGLAGYGWRQRKA
jgi:hypothetical protein